LTTGSYTPVATHNFVSDVTNELAGGGYVRKDLATRTILEDDANSRADYKADNVTWTGLTSTQTYRWAIVYKFETTDADSPLLCAIDMTSVGLTGLTEYGLKWDNAASNGRVFSV
jgi:hypothetical protein